MNKDPNIIKSPEFKDMPEERKSKMSLNEFDQEFLINHFDYRDNVNKWELAHIIDAQNALIHLKFEMIKDGVDIFLKNEKAIKEVGRYEERLVHLENYASIKWTLIRWGTAIFIALLIGATLLLWRENRKLAENKKTSDTWTPEYQLKVQNAHVRAFDPYKGLTTKQQDSIHEENEQGILKRIQQNNNK